jgi:hypothetical protein
MAYALGMSRLLFLPSNHRNEIDIMSETITTIAPATTPTACACAGADKVQPTAAPVAQPQAQPAAAPASAAPKANKRNMRKR